MFLISPLTEAGTLGVCVGAALAGQDVVSALLYLLGGEVMEGFSLALIVGIVVGTYSSIFVASSSALALGISKADLMSKPKAEGDTTP